MKRSGVLLLGLALLLVLGLWWSRRVARMPGEPLPSTTPPSGPSTGAVTGPGAAARRARPPEPRAPAGLSDAEKAARVEQIKRDYDEIRARASAEFAAAGASFPGGVNAFMRQLALLEREKRADLAAVLSPRELEDLELRETAAGQKVQQRLGSTAATDEQRRAIFRLQRELDDRFAFTFDTSPAALLEREKARQVMDARVWTVLTEPGAASNLFAAWSDDYAQAQAFTAQQGLPGTSAWELCDARNQFTVRRLEVLAQPAYSPEQRQAALADLVRQTETRVLAIVGGSAFQAGRNDVLSWLPKR